MKKILSIIGLLTLSFTLLFGFTTPRTFAQENLFDTLEDIKEGVEEKQDRIGEGGVKETVTVDVIDYSEKQPWGNLSKDLSDMLKKAGFTKLKDIADKAEYSQTKGNITDLTDYIEEIDLTDKDGNDYTLSNDEVYFIANEIRFKGESQIQSIILAVAKVMRNLIGGLAILWIVISGTQMIFAHGDESKTTEQKRAITYAVIGLIVILLLERGVVILYGVPGVERGFATTGEGISQEVYGVISFIKAIIGAAAILMIVISGFKTIAAGGEEEKITNQKKSIMWIIIGLIVIMINKFIVENLYIEPAANKGLITKTNVQNIINQIGTVTQFILGFVGVVAFGILIYGAASMIANFGNDEAVQKAKKTITHAIVGIIVILSAYAIVATVIKFE